MTVAVIITISNLPLSPTHTQLKQHRVLRMLHVSCVTSPSRDVQQQAGNRNQLTSVASHNLTLVVVEAVHPHRHPVRAMANSDVSSDTREWPLWTSALCMVLQSRYEKCMVLSGEWHSSSSR